MVTACLRGTILTLCLGVPPEYGHGNEKTVGASAEAETAEDINN
jgi:hypothetical protein